MGDRLDYQAIDLPHGYWPEMQSHALGWFKYWLKGEGTGRPCPVPPIPELPEAKLILYQSPGAGEVAPPSPLVSPPVSSLIEVK